MEEVWMRCQVSLIVRLRKKSEKMPFFDHTYKFDWDKLLRLAFAQERAFDVGNLIDTYNILSLEDAASVFKVTGAQEGERTLSSVAKQANVEVSGRVGEEANAAQQPIIFKHNRFPSTGSAEKFIREKLNPEGKDELQASIDQQIAELLQASDRDLMVEPMVEARDKNLREFLGIMQQFEGHRLKSNDHPYEEVGFLILFTMAACDVFAKSREHSDEEILVSVQRVCTTGCSVPRSAADLLKLLALIKYCCHCLGPVAWMSISQFYKDSKCINLKLISQFVGRLKGQLRSVSSQTPISEIFFHLIELYELQCEAGTSVNGTGQLLKLSDIAVRKQEYLDLSKKTDDETTEGQQDNPRIHLKNCQWSYSCSCPKCKAYIDLRALSVILWAKPESHYDKSFISMALKLMHKATKEEPQLLGRNMKSYLQLDLGQTSDVTIANPSFRVDFLKQRIESTQSSRSS